MVHRKMGQPGGFPNTYLQRCETIAASLPAMEKNGAAGCVGFDESNYRRGGRRRKLFTSEPAAIPQQLQRMRSPASTSRVYSRSLVNVWLPLEAKGRGKSENTHSDENI
jgi:hypothetical protein